MASVNEYFSKSRGIVGINTHSCSDHITGGVKIHICK